MPVPSLVDLSTKACIKNLRHLNDVGDLEYFRIRPVLLRLESPAQLHQIEANSPQICGEDVELWRNFIARDFQNWESKNYAPKNPLKWYQIYLKYKKEQQLEIARDEEILRASMGQLKKAKETNVSKVMDLKALPKVPRDPWMMANNGGIPIGKKTAQFKKEGPSGLVWSAGSKTKLTNGQSVLTRARREAKEISQMSKLAKPTHALKAQVGQVRKAPVGMVNEYKKCSAPPIRILSRKKPLDKGPSATNGLNLEDREKRLSAIQAGQKNNPSTGNETLIGSSDEDGSDDDLTFDDKPKQLSRPGSSSSPHLSSSSSKSTTPSRLITRSGASSRPTSHQPKSTYSPMRGASNTKPPPRVASSPPASTGSMRRVSPTGAEKRQPPPMVRKRAAVDIFNRGASKKPKSR